MSRFLVWVEDSAYEMFDLLSRREDKKRVRDCIVRHADEVARDLSLATPSKGPGRFLILRFTCLDGDVQVHIQLDFDVVSDAELAVLACKSIAF